MNVTLLPDDQRLAGKRAAAQAAVAEVEDGMLVGLGTGTTAAFAIAALGDRAAHGLRVTTVATSRATTLAAERAGLTVLDFATMTAVDLAIDGADEIDSRFYAIKGGGGAMLREKIVAAAARRMVAVVDAGKQVAFIGQRPVPVEVLPFALASVAYRIGQLGAAVSRRPATDGWFCSDQGNAVLDCLFESVPDPERLDAALSSIPGMLGHGLFLSEIDAVYIGNASGVSCLQRDAGRSNSASS
ncbi:MAG: ribose-5-phosphate isomerase RpiA [Janthinobacterium lividum]